MSHHRFYEQKTPGPAVTSRPGRPVEITERSPGHEDAARLLRAFYDEQVGRYGFAESIDLGPEPICCH
jgi:hypothetical protein